MSVLLRAPLDRPGVRAVLAELSLMGIDPRVVHTGRGDLMEMGDRDRAWLAAHTAWRDDADVAHDLFELWNGPEPAPCILPVATGRRIVLAPIAAPEEAIAVLLDWVEAAPTAIDATLVVVAETHDMGLGDAMASAVDDPRDLPDVVVVERPIPDMATAVADSTVVVAQLGTPAARLADELQRAQVAPGLGLAGRLVEALAVSAAPPTAAQVAAYVAQRLGRERRRTRRRPAGPPARPLVAFEGAVTSVTSLAQLNRDLARALMDRGDMDVAFSERFPGPLAADPDVAELVLRAAPLDRPPDLLIRNDDPPSFARPAAGRVAAWLHWELGPPPREWLHAAQICADEVWVDSEVVREDFLNAGLPADRVVVVPLGVDAARFGPHVPPAPLGDTDGFRFLFVGGLVHRKGVDLLLEAYRRAFTRADEVTLVLKRFGVGGPSSANELDAVAEAMAADPAGPRVRILDGPMREADMAGLYRACDCLAHPYRGEAFGMTMIEAMASGLPVIAPDRGTAREFVDGTSAVLLPAARRVLPTLTDGEGRALSGPPVVHEIDVADLAAGMRRVFEDRTAAAAIGRRAATAVRAARGWDAVAEVVASRIWPLGVTA
ncbi:MAG: glycosyltransferase family 4 protein [Thermoleophilia bacterium]|nr:glycosyltransferase family 4 protein [Thermoleophilia bacterium]